MTLKDQIIETYKIQAYSDNIIDCFYKIENKRLAGYFEKTFKACKNFANRISAKSNYRPDRLLLASLDKDEVKDFESYRDKLNEAISFCLSTHPNEINRLDKMVKASKDADMIFIDKTNMRKLLVNLRLSTDSIDEFMKQNDLK